MNLDRYVQDCAELHAAGVGRAWLCRLLRPTLGKKLLLVFAILAAIGVVNFFAIGALLSDMRGMTAVVNVTGSLRWLSQNIQLNTLRIVRGDAQARDRVHVDADLVKLDEAVRSLQEGGSAQGIVIRGLPDELQADIALVRQTSASLGRHTEQVLAEPGQGKETDALLDIMYVEGTILLKTADAIAARLTRQSQQAEQEIMDKLERLGLLDLILVVAALLAIRMRVVHPLRKLAAVSRGFAEGRRELRSGFRSLDEIGQLALAFDTMADTIERDLRQMAAGAAELEKKQQELRKFSLAIEHGPVSVVITDAAGTIEYVNPKFTETTGYAPEEAIGRQPSILKSGLTPNAVFVDMWQRLRSGRQWHGELLNRKKNGELFWEDTSIAPLKDDAGRITHFVAVKEDISGRKQSEAEIQDYSTELERRVAERTRQLSESNRELESFSYSISHDLRAPLRALNGFASLMAENCANCVKTESLEYMARIQRASLRMGSLMDDILDLSRVARSEIKVEQVDLSAMVRSILDDLAVAGPPRNVLVDVEEGLLANGDETLLQAVLENLLGNAWKFSAQGDPARIAFGCREKSGKDSGERVFFVRDNGAGFDMKYADKLFGVFQRLHGMQEFEGNGIGLAMVRRIIGLHGGRVWAEGRLGEGATFFFTLGNQMPQGASDHA